MCKSGRGWLTRRVAFLFISIFLRVGGLNKIPSKYVYTGVAYKKGATYKSEYGTHVHVCSILMPFHSYVSMPSSGSCVSVISELSRSRKRFPFFPRARESLNKPRFSKHPLRDSSSTPYLDISEGLVELLLTESLRSRT